MNEFIWTKERPGFTMSFKNGWTISVQFGYGNYCDNGHHPDGFYFFNKVDRVKAANAEIAIWDKEGEWYNFGADTVKGYCSVDEVAEWIDKVSKF
jgi:hypothetical protein